jgi:hypothetical protein
VTSRVLNALLLVTLLAGASPATSETTRTEQTHTFAAGQVWTFRLDPKEPPATLTVLRVETLASIGDVVHISVSAIRTPTGVTQVGHLPMSKSAMDKSVLELVRTDAGPMDLAGYETWKKAKGGVFTTSVSEALEFVREAMRRGQ